MLTKEGLQRVIVRVGVGGHHRFRPKAAGRVARGIESRESRESRVGAGIAVRRENTGQMNPCSPYVSGSELHAMKVVIDSRCPSADITVAKVARNDSRRK